MEEAEGKRSISKTIYSQSAPCHRKTNAVYCGIGLRLSSDQRQYVYIYIYIIVLYICMLFCFREGLGDDVIMM